MSGDIKFEGLLKDAIFLADKERGIPYYCVEPEKRGEFWTDLTKHTASKPIAQALNAIMVGRSFEEAMERFLRNLSVKISKSEEEGLKNFVSGVSKILKNYYELRQRNIQEFLKAKNSLIAAIYIFTRYPKLKEAIYGEQTDSSIAE